MVQGLVESVSTLNWVILMLLAQHWRTSPYIDWLWWVHRFVQRGFPLFCCLDCTTGFWGSKIWCSYAGSKIWCTHRLIDIPPILRLTCGFENVFKPLLLRKIRGHSMPGISLRLCLVMYSFAVCYLDEVAPHWQMWLRQWTSMDHKNKVRGEWGSRLKPCDVRFTASCGLQWCIFGLDWLRAVFRRLGGLELVAVKIAGRCLPYSIFIDIYIYMCVYVYVYVYIYVWLYAVYRCDMFHAFHRIYNELMGNVPGQIKTNPLGPCQGTIPKIMYSLVQVITLEPGAAVMLVSVKGTGTHWCWLVRIC